MTGKLCRERGVGTRATMAASLLVMLAAVIASPLPAAAQSPPYYAQGRQWIGRTVCVGLPPNWSAERVFNGIPLPPALAELCLYRWALGATPPTPAQVAALFAATAPDLVEDVPVVFPSAPFSPSEVGFFTGLRQSLKAQVGTAALLPTVPDAPPVRVVVIDTALDATAGNIHPGASRHGDTIAHLIEDIACKPVQGGRVCAAQVTTALALPLISSGGPGPPLLVPGPNGGYVGTLSDLARAITRAAKTWQDDRIASPATTPARLVLNLSIGWEHTASVADCTTAPPPNPSRPRPADAVRGALQFAASIGALIVSAGGNDPGGPTPHTDLICPALYQELPQTADPSQPLVVGVSSVDYRDGPLETARRPNGATALAALGLGGVAWNAADPVPPQLIGTSVSTAVVSAIASLVWGVQTNLRPSEVARALYDGGPDVGPAQRCPLSIPGCRAHRASVCGALRRIGVPTSCTIPPPRTAGSPALPSEVAALIAAFGGGPRTMRPEAPPTNLPRDLVASVQLDPYAFPTPISDTCPSCVVNTAVAATPPMFLVPQLARDINVAVLVVTLPSGSQTTLRLGDIRMSGTPYVFPVPGSWIVRSAYLTGLDLSGHSVTDQIFVQP